MAKRLLLAGYIGCGNLGDDAMALGLLHALGDDPFDVTVLSGNPDSTYSNYKLQSVPRMNMAQVDKAIAACDALVFPGGSIFQDVSSVRSVAYYWRLVSRAKKAGKKVVLLGQGIGPLNRFLGKKLASAAFRAADAIAVRDPGSASTLKTLGVNRPVKVTADPAFLLPPPSMAGDAQGFQVGNMRSVGIAPRPLGRSVDVAALFAEVAKLLFQGGMMPVLIEMDRTEDGPLIQEIRNRMGGKAPDLRKLASPMQLQERMARMDAVLAMRLHAGVLAASVGVPPMLVSYDPKVDALAKALGLGGATPVASATPKGLVDAFTRFVKDRDKHATAVASRRDELKKQASENVALLRETLKKG